MQKDILLQKAARIIKRANNLIVFTGAGISVESGVPSFRGKDGLWNNYDPKVLTLSYFRQNPEHCWEQIREIFYSYFAISKPNKAHEVLARMEKHGLLKAIITQNIDNLHQIAGSENVIEFHGNSHNLICKKCNSKYIISDISLDILPPRCKKCSGILKPDFVFFEEEIPIEAFEKSMQLATTSDVFIIIGTTGEVVPASYLPAHAKQHNAVIIEINPEKSNYTNSITDIYLSGKAGEIMSEIEKSIFK